LAGRFSLWNLAAAAAAADLISKGALRPLEWCCGNGCLRATQTRLDAARESLMGSASDTCTSLMYFAFFPLLFGGIFLGTLVVVGQGSKEGSVPYIDMHIIRIRITYIVM
jgi:hypothetical protein